MEADISPPSSSSPFPLGLLICSSVPFLLYRNNALPPVLILSVCAVAARFTSSPNICSTSRQYLRGEEWASHARDICTRRYEWPNITILTCLLILGLHEFGTCHGSRSWALGGQAIRMAFALQLHKDLEYDPLSEGGKTQLSFIDREIRRRIMWACFLMDRFNSSGSDRPMFIKEESLKIPLPVRERCFQLDMPAQTEALDGSVAQTDALHGDQQLVQARENMGVAAYTIRSIAVWGRIMSYLNQGGREADVHPAWSDDSRYGQLVREVDRLAQTLPPSCQYSPENLDLQRTEKTSSQYILLHLSIQQNKLFLRQAVVASADSQTSGQDKLSKEIVLRARTEMMTAACQISALLRDAEQAQCYVSAPFAGYCALASTTVQIPSIFSGTPAVKATAEANSAVNIRFLRKMSRYWGMFHWMVETVREQYRQGMDAARSGELCASGSSTFPLLQYGDWFNKYPGPELELMELGTQRRQEKGEDAVLEQKPELQSVEEYFTTLSPPQSVEGTEAGQGGLAKRKQSVKQTNSGGGSKTMTELMAKETVTSRQGASRPQSSRAMSAALRRRPSGSGGLSPLPRSHAQTAAYAAASPVSPVLVHQFAQARPVHNDFMSAQLLRMNMPQPQPPTGSLVQPAGHAFSFTNFSAEATGPMPNGSAMMDGGGMSGWPMDRFDMKAGNEMSMGGRPMMADTTLPGYGVQEAAVPVWYTPFGPEMPPVGQGVGAEDDSGGMDLLAQMFGGGGLVPTDHQSLDAAPRPI